MSKLLTKRKNSKKPKITTNNQIREFISEAPQHVLDDYYWLDMSATGYGWIHYKNHWYHVSDFSRIDEDAPKWMQEWDGYNPDSFFSGVVIKLGDDPDEEYIIGTYIG